jgi:hypothetical protein
MIKCVKIIFFLIFLSGCVQKEKELLRNIKIDSLNDTIMIVYGKNMIPTYDNGSKLESLLFDFSQSFSFTLSNHLKNKGEITSVHKENERKISRMILLSKILEKQKGKAFIEVFINHDKSPSKNRIYFYLVYTSIVHNIAGSAQIENLTKLDYTIILNGINDKKNISEFVEKYLEDLTISLEKGSHKDK